MAPSLATNVYIDGFNLYYGCVRNTPHRWLDVHKMSELLLPGHAINAIKYYTANITGLPHDPDQPTRQQTYLRALATLPDVTIIKGHFLSHRVKLPLAAGSHGTTPKYTAAGNLDRVAVIKTEEKGSDVNVATHLLLDAVTTNYDFGVVVSNDSDLLEPIRIVREQFGKQVGLLNPH